MRYGANETEQDSMKEIRPSSTQDVTLVARSGSAENKRSTEQ